MDYSTPLKIVVVGDSDVGKSTLLGRLASGVFRTNLISTVGIDYVTQTVKAHGKSIKLQIWDTAGQERYRSLTNAYFRGAAGAVLMYDITDRRSFDDVQNWMDDMSAHGSATIKAVMVGHKSDLEGLRVVTIRDGQKLAENYHVPFMEASSKTGSNCLEIFTTLAENITSEHYEQSGNSTDKAIPLSSHHGEPGSGCCK